MTDSRRAVDAARQEAFEALVKLHRAESSYRFRPTISNLRNLTQCTTDYESADRVLQEAQAARNRKTEG